VHLEKRMKPKICKSKKRISSYVK